ncbi:hypothetical protein V8D89_006805 [Ganoderma adspersum]
MSPAALATETAPPLPQPPAHLFSDLTVQAALHQYRDDVKVETPFRIDHLRSLLADHPNQPFIESVLWGLQHGFWPLDEGGWDMEDDEQFSNYPMEESDLNAVRTFRDREAKVRYDAMQDFGQALHNAHRQFPNHPFTLYKSDISKVFLNLPVHPIWQLRQVVEVESGLHIIRHLVFRSHASP